MSFKEDITNYIRASYPCIYIVAREEWRAMKEIEDVCKSKEIDKPHHTWTITNGVDYDLIRKIPNPKILTDPVDFIKMKITKPENAVYSLINFHFNLDTPEMVQMIKDCMQIGKGKGQTLIFISNIWKVPQELVGDITRIDFALPDKKLLRERIKFVINSIEMEEKEKNKIIPSVDEEESIVEAGLGMTTWEFENSITLSLVKNKKIDTRFISDEKAKTVAKSGILEFYTPDVNMSDVGGLDNLKEWLSNRKQLFGIEAQKYGLPNLKGILLIGIPGCGKSHAIKAIANFWGIPLIRFDLGKLFQGLVGASEERTRQALELANAVAPCILFIDEIEKGMAGMGGNGNTDSGVTSRVFGSILSWMQDKTRPVFVAATGNSIQNLPPELMRAGRWDEIFFIDLPNEEERADILKIHIKRRNRDYSKFNIKKIVDVTDQFSGAELESIITKAMIYGFAEKREFTTEDIIKAASKTIPLAIMRKEEINSLREWAKTRAVFASKQQQEVKENQETKRYIKI